MPKVFRLTKGKENKLEEALFGGAVINNVTMLCVEDYLDALRWFQTVGGLDYLVYRLVANLNDVEMAESDWIKFLAQLEII